MRNLRFVVSFGKVATFDEVAHETDALLIDEFALLVFRAFAHFVQVAGFVFGEGANEEGTLAAR
jgi:hypothetical protein